MAKILLGWELGSNRGHIQHLVDLATALEACGDTVVYALQQVDALSGLLAKQPVVLQAPLWPRLLKTVTQPPAPTTATMGDILDRIGLTQVGTLSAMVGSWDAILSMVKPDLVVADFAPALGCAARGRIPMIGIGVPFCHPSPSMPEFPNFFGDMPSRDQNEMLAVVNRELEKADRAAISALPQLFAFDRMVVIGFTELDPYARWRSETLFAPSIDVATDLQLTSRDKRDEIFVYYYQSFGEVKPLWEALEATHLPVRVYVPRLDQDAVLALEKRGFIVERAPVAWGDIAARSRIVVSHGGAGFVSTALAVGLPQVIAYYDVEKMLTARAVGELGLGSHVYASQIDPQLLSSELSRIYHDQDIAARARSASHHFRQQLSHSALMGAITAANELLGRS